MATNLPTTKTDIAKIRSIEHSDMKVIVHTDANDYSISADRYARGATKDFISDCFYNDKYASIKYETRNKEIVDLYYAKKDFVSAVSPSNEDTNVLSIALQKRPTLVYLNKSDVSYEYIIGLLNESLTKKIEIILAINPVTRNIEYAMMDK